MKLEIDEFCLDRIFNKIEVEDDFVYWRECVDSDGYMLLFSDGSHHHTYHHPERIFE